MIRIIVALAVLAMPAAARANGGENQPDYLRQWFQQLMHPDNPLVSSCGEADAFEADHFQQWGDQYIAVITDGKGIVPEGTRVLVPTDRIIWDKGNPTGHGIIFIGNGGQVHCYVTPGSV
jgi:hypothetical protein